MSLWFIFAVASFVFGGFHIFAQKIGAEKGYDSNLINTYSAALSAVIGIVAVAVLEGFSELSIAMVTLGLLGGVVFIIGSNLRMDALRYIDTTIYLPLHKFVSPIAAIVFGIVFFQESMTGSEWIGILLGVTVPLLLITRDENTRQKDLQRGLILMVITAIIGAIVAAINKLGADLFTSVLLFATITHIFSSLFGIVTHRIRKQTGSGTNRIHSGSGFFATAAFSGVFQAVGFGTFMLAFAFGGQLAIVYLINSLYILIPIILSIIFFNEHWNIRKILAIVLSIGSLAFLR